MLQVHSGFKASRLQLKCPRTVINSDCVRSLHLGLGLTNCSTHMYSTPQSCTTHPVLAMAHKCGHVPHDIPHTTKHMQMWSVVIAIVHSNHHLVQTTHNKAIINGDNLPSLNMSLHYTCPSLTERLPSLHSSFH